MIQKLALGTVQFGLQYGINNEIGQVTPSRINEILSLAHYSGVELIDTAHSYGDSEEQLGVANINKFKVVSKLPVDFKDVKTTFELSTQRLKVDKLYGYLLHSFSIYKSTPQIWEELVALKNLGKVNKIGFSLYTIDELDKILDDGIIPDLIQIPFNIFDQHFTERLHLLNSLGVQIHTRSTFLQGLFFSDVKKINSHFSSVKSKIEKIQSLAIDNNMKINELCIQFVLLTANIDKVVVGVDSVNQLKENITSFGNSQMNLKCYENLLDLKENNTEIIYPQNWKF
jgi:aryl-alcohol dehydrogenase-like predicted oxidoreductase